MARFQFVIIETDGAEVLKDVGQQDITQEMQIMIFTHVLDLKRREHLLGVIIIVIVDLFIPQLTEEFLFR